MSPAYGHDAVVFASRAKDVQDILGEHQDSMVSQDLLRDLAAGETEAEAALVYGRLLVLEEGISSRTQRRWEELWAEVRGLSMTGWLKG